MESLVRDRISPGMEFLGLVWEYIDGRIALEAVRRWLARHTTWVMMSPRDPISQLAAVIELGTAELDLGHATEEDLIADIRSFLSEELPRILATSGGAISSTSSTTICDTIDLNLTIQGERRYAGTLRGTVCV
jgi:hypothetical protein